MEEGQGGAFFLLAIIYPNALVAFTYALFFKADSSHRIDSAEPSIGIDLAGG